MNNTWLFKSLAISKLCFVLLFPVGMTAAKVYFFFSTFLWHDPRDSTLILDTFPPKPILITHFILSYRSSRHITCFRSKLFVLSCLSGSYRSLSSFSSPCSPLAEMVKLKQQEEHYQRGVKAEVLL